MYSVYHFQNNDFLIPSGGSSIPNMTPPVSYEIFELNKRPPAYSFR